MIDYLLLALAILLATIIWPILRLGLKNGARTEQLGIITSMVAVFFIIILGLILQIPIYEQKASLIGIIAGSAYAIGFYYVTIHCLKIGPTGPTVTITNLGLIWPVLISITFFNQNFDSIILLGFCCIHFEGAEKIKDISFKVIKVWFTCNHKLTNTHFFAET